MVAIATTAVAGMRLTVRREQAAAAKLFFGWGNGVRPTTSPVPQREWLSADRPNVASAYAPLVEIGTGENRLTGDPLRLPGTA